MCNIYNMLKRQMEEEIASLASKMPVITLIGPRQSGKTTLVKKAFPDHDYVSLERPDSRREAQEDPLSFLAAHTRGVVLDEVHRVPDLLSYIQVSVDEDDRPGRFVLTASQNILLMEKVSQTLAGRTAILRLLPFSLGELFGRDPLDPRLLTGPPTGQEPPPRHMWDMIWTGFYPRIHDKRLDPQRWLSDYFRTYVERDLRAVLRVMELDTFERFVRLAAARTGTELNLLSLAEDTGISQPTAKTWMGALRIGSIVTLLPPHHESYKKRLRKRPRLHFLDTGLVCYLLGIPDGPTLQNHPLRGAIFETFVVAELTKAFEHRGLEAPLYFFRDATGHEIDVLVDLGDRLLPVEVKSGLTVTPESFNGLRWWTGLPGNHNKQGVLVHGGTGSGARYGFTLLPWFLR